MKNQIRVLPPFILLCTVACGGMDLSPSDSLSSRQPRVLLVEPEDGATVLGNVEVSLEFSRPLDPSSVSSETLAVVKDDGGPDETVESISKGRRTGVDGVYAIEDGGRRVVFTPADELESSATYRIVATNGIVSIERIPLATALVSSFTVEGGASADSGSAAASGDGADGTASGGSDSGTDSGGGPSSNRPRFLVINELLYDIPGDDTNGTLFVELFGDAGADIGGYRLNFINGGNGASTGTVTLPSGAAVGDDGIYLIADAKTGQSGQSFVEGADFVANFDPQNGPDCVQLLSDTAELVDALGYGTPIAALAENNLACFEGTPAAKALAGKSLSRVAGADTENNSADFTAPTAPTPGVL